MNPILNQLLFFNCDKYASMTSGAIPLISLLVLILSAVPLEARDANVLWWNLDWNLLLCKALQPPLFDTIRTIDSILQ